MVQSLNFGMTITKIIGRMPRLELSVCDEFQGRAKSGHILSSKTACLILKDPTSSLQFPFCLLALGSLVVRVIFFSSS